MTYSAYSKTQNLTPQSSRDVEYRLLGQVTVALLDAEANQDNVAKRVDAISWNREVWAALRRDLTHPENGLSAQIKNDLVDLANWVDRETFRILSGDSKTVDALIDVNKNIMEGLKPKASKPAENSDQPPAN
jgi:flagellar protein FlaF